MEILSDHPHFNISASLTSITSSITNMQRDQLNSSTFVDNFKNTMHKELSSVCNNFSDISMRLEYIKKSQDSTAKNLGGQIQTQQL